MNQRVERPLSPAAALAGLLALSFGCQGNIEGSGRPAPETSGTAGSNSGPAGGSSAVSAGGMPGTGASTGDRGGAGSSSSSAGMTGIAGDPNALCAQTGGSLAVGLTRLRRLTRSQFNHTVRDLLGVTTEPAAALSPDESIGPFFSNAIAPITDLLVQQHDEIAASLAAGAVSRMSELAGCALATDTSGACAAEFIAGFGAKAHRRPLTPAEHEEYLALYEQERAAGSVESAFQLVVETLLESPFFLYHSDAGASGAPASGAAALTAYELASRLSYFLWDSMPDAELFALAAADSLGEEAVLSAQVARMLADPKAADAIPEFHLAWLGMRDLAGITKDPTRFPSFDGALVAAMRAETASFTDYVVRRGDGLFTTLLTAPFSFPSAPLFELYGLTPPAGLAAGDPVPLDATQRGGVLTQAGFLAMHAHREQTSPVHRGIVVRENLLCQPLDPPPPNVNATPLPPSTAQTTRERFAQHEADPTCAGCHVLIDPIGLAFENYDAIGAYRTTENGTSIDASGEILEGGDDVAGSFVGVLELERKLAGSGVAADCLVNQWFRFALGRMESNDDACSVQAIRAAFRASGGNVRDLLGAIAKSDAFRNVRLTGKSP